MLPAISEVVIEAVPENRYRRGLHPACHGADGKLYTENDGFLFVVGE